VGGIPSSFANLTNLRSLDLHDNQLSGGIVESLGNLFNLRELLLQNNQLSGHIPSSLGNHSPYLSYLNLSNNQFSGSIPKSLGLTELKEIILNNNRFKDSIPASLGDLKNLTKINLSNNRLSGAIPASLGNLLKLQNLYLSNNKLSGTIPESLSNLYYPLWYLDLSGNQLSGSIPESLGKLKNLWYLNLAGNQLSGSIPSSLGKLFQDSNYYYPNSVLNLSKNNLTRMIPDSLSYCKSLKSLDLSDNQLGGKIPKNFFRLYKLQKLYLQNNTLKSTVPSFFAWMNDLDTLNIGWNKFTFDGLEFLSKHAFNEFSYSSQGKIKMQKTNSTLSVYAGGTLNNNTYKWFNNGILVSTKTGDSTFTPTVSGKYSVEVTNSIATALTLKSDAVSFNTFTAVTQNNSDAIKATDNKTGFSLYPNPAKNNVTVSFIGNGSYTIKLADVNGNVLQTRTDVAVNNKNTIQLNVGKYANGVYFITITNDNNTTRTLKLYKQ